MSEIDYTAEERLAFESRVHAAAIALYAPRVAHHGDARLCAMEACDLVERVDALLAERRKRFPPMSPVADKPELSTSGDMAPSEGNDVEWDALIEVFEPGDWDKCSSRTYNRLMTAYRAGKAHARAGTLEQAAKACEAIAAGYIDDEVREHCGMCAAKIRALAGTRPGPVVP